MYLVKKAAYKYAMLKLSEVRKVQVELTTRCNARCPMCMRNYRGLDYNSGYPVTELSLQQFQHIFTPEFCQQLTGVEPIINGFQKKYFGQSGVSFNGNLGDFASARDAVEIVEYLVQHRVPVHVNTNGSLRTPDWWRKLAQPSVTVGFALDGLADTHHLYRQDTDWHKIIANAQAFISAGGQAVWRFVPFDHNRHQEDQCRQLAQDMGFAKFENIYDGRDSGPVFTRTGEYSHRIGTDSGPAGHQPQVEDLLANHITWFDSRTVKSHKDVPDLNLRCIHKINREIYIAANGSVYPCCYLGFYPETMHHAGNSQTKELVQENNALEYDLAHCLSWFDGVEQTWAKDSIADGRLYQCVNSCGAV
jgi:MoaA/NifB/PqqE/SkfB family radical SAM enzyme